MSLAARMSAVPQPDVSIVIPSWRGRALLMEFLPSVITAAQHYRQEHQAQVEIIVVDDAGGDDTGSWLAENYPDQVQLVTRPENGGFARAANSGFQAAQFPIILLLNNDIRIEPTAIAPLVRHFQDQQVFGVCAKAYRLNSDLFDGAGKLGLFQKGHWRIFLSYDILPTRLPDRAEPFYSFVASGGYSAFQADKLRELGGFCELLSPFYWEDADLCYRAWKRGWQIHYEPASIVYHQSSATIGQKFSSTRVAVIAERNRLLMHWMNLHDPSWLLLHLCWLVIKLFGATITLDRYYWLACWQALKLLPAAREIRQRERRAQRRSDREVEAIFRKLIEHQWVAVIRNPADYYRYVELKEQLGGQIDTIKTDVTQR